MFKTSLGGSRQHLYRETGRQASARLPSRTWLCTLLLLWAQLGLTACSEDTDSNATDSPSRTTQELSLNYPEGIEPPASFVSLWEIEATPKATENWTADGMEFTRLEGSSVLDAPHLLVRKKGKDTLINIPGPFDITNCNQIALSVMAQGEIKIYVRFLKGGKPVSASNELVFFGQKNIEHLYFDLSEHKINAADSMEIRFPVHGIFPAIALLKVSALQRPPIRFFASPRDAEPQCEVLSESRPAVGLDASRPLITESFNPGLKQRLEFTFGPVPKKNKKAKVLVTLLSAETGEVVVSRKFGFERPGWTRIKLPLEKTLKELRSESPELAGQALQAKFELLGLPDTDGACAVSFPLLIDPSKRPRTVLLITSDTHRADRVGWSNSEIKTTFFNKAAEAGAAYSNTHSAINITTPSHASLMTGLPPRDTLVISNVMDLQADANTLAEQFSAAGYRTFAAVSSSHLRPSLSGLGQGFHAFRFPIQVQSDSADTFKHFEQLLEDSADQNVFAWLHLFDAHAPYMPPAEYTEAYYDNSKDPYSEELSPLGRAQRAAWDLRIRDVEYIKAQYNAEVTYQDEGLSRLFGRHKRLRNATVAITADHGESLGERGTYWKHNHVWPEVLHVPTVLFGKNVPKRELNNALAANYNLARTLLDLADLKQVSFPGFNLIADEIPDRPHFAIATGGTTAAMRLGNWFYRLHLRANGGGGGEVGGLNLSHSHELYNLKEDPICLRDVSGEEPERVLQMRRATITWLSDGQPIQREAADTAADSSVLEEMAALGYAGQEVVEISEWFAEDCQCKQCKALEQ